MNCNSCRWINEITPKEYNNAACHPPVEFHCLYPYRRGDNFYCVNFEPKQTCANFEKDDWISVRDKLPDTETKIKLKCYDGYITQGTLKKISIYGKKQKTTMYLDEPGYADDVTHWKPLLDKQFSFGFGNDFDDWYIEYNGAYVRYSYLCQSPGNLVKWLNAMKKLKG